MGNAFDISDKLPANCAACGYHTPSMKCVRHSPSPGHDELYIRAHWPFTRPNERCGVGTTTKTPVRCDDCIHWHRPDDMPWPPDYQFGLSPMWWERARLCTAAAPYPNTSESLRTYWRVTHAVEGCAEGVSIAQTLAEKLHQPADGRTPPESAVVLRFPGMPAMPPVVAGGA